MKKSRAEFEFKGYDVRANGTVRSESYVTNLNYHFIDIPETEWPTDSTFLKELRETCYLKLIDSVYEPNEVTF